MNHWTCSRHISWFQQRGVLYAYHDLFGYILEMSPDVRALWACFDTPTALPPDAASPHLQTLCDHDLLVPEGCDELALLLDRYPIKGPWTITYDDPAEGVRAVVGRNPESTPQILQLTQAQSALWRALTGLRTTAELAQDLAQDPLVVAAWLAAWTHSGVQLTRMDRVSARFYDHQHTPRPPYLSSTMPFPSAAAEVHDPNPPRRAPIDLRDYHQHTIQDAQRQFDETETTLSHLFRNPHEALQNKTYAESLLGGLRRLGLLPTLPCEVVEVGGGIGAFAQGLLTALRAQSPEHFPNIRYRIFDISPELSRSQRAYLKDFPCAQALLADAEALELPEGSVDLLISNEVIGDLRTTFLRWESDPEACGTKDAEEDEEDEELPWFDPDSPPGAEDTPASTLTGDPQTLEALARLRVDVSDAPSGEFAINLGPLLLLERLYKWLKPGGVAVLTEFGDLWRYPVESTHLDHAEFSIHFGHLLQAAKTLGFVAQVVDVFDLLAFDGAVEVLASARTYQRNLAYLLASRGVALEKVAYTRPMFEALLAKACLEPARLHTIQFRPLEERVMGLAPREFKALLLRK